MTHDIHIVGGGLAGSEAAWQLAEAGFRVRLSEMRGSGERTPAHQTDGLAELVCSNSFRSDDAEANAVGLLHQEMRRLGSLIMAQADAHRVPAGTVTITIYFHAGSAELLANGCDFLLGQAQAQAFRNGFFDQSAQLWSRTGVLLATTQQLVYFKE